jgi:hypothetical protein
LLQHRGNDLDFFAAEVSAFAAVRIEPGDQDARLGDAESLLQRLAQYAQRRRQHVARNCTGHLGQRHVRGGEATRRPPPASIITTRGVEVSAARYSVWPVKGMPASLIAPLCTGAVTIAAKLASMQPATARSIRAST